MAFVRTWNSNTLNNAIDSLQEKTSIEKLETYLGQLIEELSLSAEDENNMEQLRKELEKQFKKDITIFGSVSSRSAFKGADLDIWLDLNVDPALDGWEETREVMTDMVHDVICKMDNISKVRCLRNPRVPVIKFTDTRYNVDVDLSFKTRLSVYNSELLRAYCDVDPLIRIFLMLLKLWAKSQNLVSYRDLTNYDLSLMGSFILMQKDIGLIRPLSEMRPDGQQIPIEGWNCFFDPVLAKGQPTRTFSTMDLFIKFFHFYSEMDYSSSTICLFLGRRVKTEDIRTNKTHELNKQLVGSNSDGPINPSTICLQDPFDLHFNTSYLVEPTFLEKFVDACRKAIPIAERIAKSEAPFSDIIPLETLRSH